MLVTDEIRDRARDAVRRLVRARMAEHRWRYEDAAERSGVGKATLSRFLNGDTRSSGHWPREAQLRAISEGLGFGPDGLIEAYEHEVERLVAVELGVLFGGEGPGEVQHDHLDLDLGPAALEGLSRQEIQRVELSSRLAALKEIAEIHREKHLSVVLPVSA